MKRINYLIFFVVSILYVACNPKLNKEELVGQWKVSAMKVEIPNVPPQLIKNAEILALATTYEFNADMTYSMTISQNELESGRKQTGAMVVNANNISLTTDSLLFDKNGNWISVENNDNNSSFFKPMEITVEKFSMNQLVISERDANGIIYYTLDRKK